MLSKKLKKKLKTRILISISSVAMILMLIAIGKLTVFSTSFENFININSLNQMASENMENTDYTGDTEYIEDTEIAQNIDYSENTENIKSAQNTEIAQVQESEIALLSEDNVQEASAQAVSTTSVTVASDGAIVCDSIVQGVRDSNLADGNYTFRVTGDINGTTETKDYAVELINYYDDVTYSLADGETTKTISLGDETTEYKMLVVKYHKNLTVDQGVTVTATAVSNLTYKKGMYLCVMGELKNKGTISMTARGTYNQAGENVYLWKNIDNSFEYVPAVGGAGGAGASMSVGNPGTNGINRSTGGGGSGGSTGTNAKRGGNGSAGTSYSGGSGGGGAYHCAGAGTYTGGDAGVNGGAGGIGSARTNNGSNKTYASGGAGNLAGAGAYRTSSGNAYGNAGTYAQNGTGGLLTIYADSLCNIGTISSDGSNVVGARYSSTTRYAGGGASGGGSVNLFVRETIAKGTIQANGGTSTVNTSGITYAITGSRGGAGTVTYIELYADLNYEKKSLELNINTNYNIERNKFSYLDQNGIQTNLVTLGSLSYESLDTDIATVDNNGKITAVAEGTTKIKITDTTNNLSTYIYLDVINNVKIDVQEGKNFSVALKQNGTVWSYGLNTSGQLGIGNNDNQLEPVQVSNLSNVKQITTGYSHTLALLSNGEVYSWGLGTGGQLGNGNQTSSNVPVKVDGVSNIVKIDAYKNISIALAEDGKVYVWGEGYSTLPMRVVFSETVIDISGTLMLTNKGRVYSITNTTSEIANLNNIAKISCGEAHNLALSTHGMTFTWGTNTYGECGIATTGTISVRGIIDDITNISAGSCISILKSEDGKIYVLGNNANGQIGVGTTAKVVSITELSLGVEIENISAGEGTHSSLIAENGFVWNTGLNTYGELGTGNNTSKTAYSQIGKTIITTNFEQKYLDINESATIVAKLENTFNLKIDLIDDNQDNFSLSLSNTDKLSLNNKTVTAVDYGSTIITVSHNTESVTKDVEIVSALKMESIVQGFKNLNLTDGEYIVVINEQAYTVELINYYDDVRYSLAEGETESTISLGDDSTEYKTLVVKYHKDLIIDSGVTLTATSVNNLTYKKGMYICVLGDTYNNGTITMTARGTYNQAGENVYLWKNIDNSFEYVPADGGAGGIGVGMSVGNAGTAGINRSTGGGGSGGSTGTRAKKGGNGSAGTSYSGGSGGGGAYHCAGTGTYAGGDAGINGGAGGTGSTRTNNSSNKSYASGGAGNLAGAGAYRTSSGNTFGGAGTFAENGTGGLLTLYTDNLYNEGIISSNGSNVIGKRYSSTTRYAGGGASGGGSVNIFANFVNAEGTIQANGGISTVNGSGMKYYISGSRGGAGTVTINELGSVLNYAKKKIQISIQDTYTIDRAKLSYTKLNEIQTEDLTVGSLSFEVEDNSIASVDSTGKITGLATGKTKVKITDLDNGYSTYIIITVTNTGLIVPQIKQGTDHTIALKANGTVWSYGLNGNGQLGNNSTEDSNEPIEVLTQDFQSLKNIVDIGAGYSSSIALSESGEVYTWGLYKYLDDSGTAQTENRLVATKESTLSNIIKVDSYKNNFYAIDSDSNAYIWGEGYLEPTIIQTNIGIEDVSGDLLLGEDGRVYFVENPTVPVTYLSNICEIASGENHYLFLTLDGYAYSFGTGDLGQLGNGTYTQTTVPTFIRTADGYLNNIYSISAGTKTSMAVTFDGKAYVFGDNTNTKLGITETKTAYPVEITSVQDKNGDVVELEQMEIVEAGKNHSTISDIDGFVYTVGLNTNGQLGTEDNVNRKIFTKIGNIEIVPIPNEINIPIGITKEISIALRNTFNIKRDIPEEGEVELTNTNEKEITVGKIENVDNSQIVDIQDFIPNYKLTGNRIGRVNLIGKSNDGQICNFWVNVVNNETAIVSAKVVNGNGFTITLRSDGTVWSFGKNTNGQLGLSDTTNRNKPEKINISEEIIDISSGENHTLLLGKSGKVYAFGLNNKGQLGLGNTTTYRVPTVLSIQNIVKVIAKGNVSFAITEGGRVYVWGEGYSKTPTLLSITKTVETGELDESGNPITIEVEENIIDISKSYYLTDDGIVRRIVDNEKINLSLNEYDPSEEPVYVEEKIMEISEGTDHLMALGQSGRVYTYGKNIYGQLGDGTINSRENLITTVVRIEDGSILENIVEISAGDRYSIIVTQDGKVYTFGINGQKQLGFDNLLENGGIQESAYALLKEDISNVERVTAGYVHTSVYKEDGNVYTWGQGVEGELGNGDNSDYYEAQLVGKNIIQTNTNEIIIEQNQNFDIDSEINYFNLFEEKQSNITYEVLDGNLAIVNTATGEIMAIGEGRTTVVAREVGTENIAVIPLRILPSGTKPNNMSILIEPQAETSGSHTIMLKVDGTVWCYGVGTYGELGNGKEEVSDEPVQAIFPEGTIITKIAAGENHCLALDSNGNVWVWGRNNYYQLGNSNSSNLLVPTKVSGLSNIKDIAAGTYTSFAIGEAGEVYSWGLNANGEGGIGSYTNKITVSKAKFVTDAIDIKAGKNHTMILKSTGEVFVTGSNLYGELGTNSSERKTNQFTKVDSLNNVVAISTGDSNNTVIKADGSIYSWGANIYNELGVGSSSTSILEPTKVQGLQDIRYIDGGKGYSLAINSSNEVFVNGLNLSGQLGNNSKTNVNGYTKLSTIENVISVSGGNAYTVMVKADGTVWACGDYTNGDEDIKSKTKSTFPIQVGNDQTGLGETQITINVNGTKEVAANCSYAFNLISLDDNFADTLTYTSLNEDIATVDSEGIVTGIRVGTTRVNAISNIDGKIYSVLINVIPEGSAYAPKVEAGEDFATVLKADGSVWAFGYNSDGRLGIGNSLTKDIPTKTNIISTYEDIKAGKDFVIALRTDGSVWSVGNNKNGQLGNGTTTSQNKLAQISNLEDIVKIEAGENFVIAIDKLGIVYGWGNNSNGQLGSQSQGNNILSPTAIQTSSQRVIDIGAGKTQSAFVTAKGTVFGYGNILNGILVGMENAIKVQVTDDSIVILTADNNVYQYKDGNLTQVVIPNKVIDISATNGSVMYQTVDEKTYVSGENTYGELGVGNTQDVITPVLVNLHGENTYTIGAGYNNTYILENTGNLYASGNNEYGSIGNGTRESQLEHILVGDRIFKVEPETATMNVGDIEEIEITGEPFNVFGETEISSDEYNWESDEDAVVSVIPGKLTAEAEGTAHITITDKVTNESITLTRVVVEPESDRIAKITVNNEVAVLDETSTENNIKYKVQVVTNENKGTLIITTNDLTDRISIDGGTSWSYNGSLNQEIELTDKITEIPIIVGVQNNNGEYPVELNYTLTVEKITDDITIKEITVTSTDSTGAENTINALPVSLTRYEVAVEEGTIISLVDVFAGSEYSYVSIDGLDYTIQEQTKNIVIGNELTKEVKIVVKSEAGTEVEYTLVIYKKNELMNLSSLKVNGEEATKVSEGVYAVTVTKDTDIATIVATAQSSLAEISIANNDYTVRINTKELNLESDTTIVPIKVRVENEIKEYTLYIYREQETEITPELKLHMLMVNGSVISPEADGLTYIAYLPSTEVDATIRAIAKDVTTKVKIAENEEEIADSEKIVLIPNNENTFKVLLTGEDGNTMEYTVIIRKAEADASIDRIYVSNGDTDIEGIIQVDGSYLVKVPSSYTTVDVTGIAKYAKAKVQVANTGNYIVHQDTQNVTLANDETTVNIKVQSEDGTNENEYTLNIVKLSNNADLAKVEVDGVEAVLGADGNYHYTLTDAKNSVYVKAITDAVSPVEAWVKIENAEYALYEMTKQVDIVSKQTEVPIKVKAEDGTVKDYKLIIEGLPDDTNIAKVTVNGKDATYIDGQNRYEIRSEDTVYNIEVTLSDLLASMVLGDNPKAIGIDNITVTKTGSETQVKVVVTSQNGLETEEYIIAILEKSSNSNLDTLYVDGNIINPDLNGNYKATIKNNATQVEIQAIAEDTYATTTINGNANNSYIASVTESVADGQIIYNYTIIVVAEDGTTSEYRLEVERLEANTNITSVLVGNDEINLIEATLQPDGSYYYKIDRVEEAYVTVNLESEKSTVTIDGIVGEPVKVSLPEDKNTFIIQVVAEDGTTKEVTLVIEKESNDLSLKSITGTGVLEIEIKEDSASIYVDEDLTTVDLTITLTNLLASLKLTEEETYEVNNITRTIDLSGYATEGVVEVNLSLKAEDGTEKEYIISIFKQANLNLDSVVVNSDILTFDEENQRYFKLVSYGNKPQIVITPSNTAQTVQLLDINENVLATATGTLTTTQTLSTTDLTTQYMIKIISHNGEEVGSELYELVIRQKSQETGITYVKVDSLGTTVTSDGLSYSSTVAGKEKYPIEIKLKDEKANVRIEDTDGNILINNQTGLLIGELAVADGEIKVFTIIVTSENGDEKEYKLQIERISSNLEIDNITVTDYDTDGATIINKNVVNYDPTTKTYKIVVNRFLTSSDVTVTAVSSFTDIILDSTITGTGTAIVTKHLNGLGITDVKIELTAADGSQDTRYLQIIQLSDEIGIQAVEVDGIAVLPNGAGDYETTVTDEVDLSEVKVTLPVTTSKVSINGKTAEYGVSTVNVSKGNNRQLQIPIKVTAEDGTTYTYTLTLNIISHDTSVQEVDVDGVKSSFVNEKYVAYFDKYATEVNIEIIAGVKYSTVSHIMEDSTEISELEKLSFIMQTPELTQEIYETTFKVTAEDGTEKEYTIQCIRKNDDNTISGVYVNDIELQPNSGNPDYADGTYYIAITEDTAKVKVEANNEFATVSFNGKNANKKLEQTITLSTTDKITEVPVTITSQQGTTLNTVIYIEKVSNNNNLTSIKVNNELAETTETENSFISYIYENVTTAKVEITAENAEATIVRTTETGETYLDEHGESSQAKGTLTMSIPTIEQTTIIYFKIVAEDGSESPVYTLQIEKMSTDTTLKEIYVDGVLVEPNEEGKYVTSVLDTVTNPVVKAVTNHELAHVRISLGDEKLHISEEAVTMSNNQQTIIPITVRSQAGISKVTYLYINKISTSVALSSVTLNDKEADSYNEYTYTYRFMVEENETDFELFVVAENDYTTLEYDGVEYEASFKTIINLSLEEDGKTLQVKAKSESGAEQIYTIEIARKSNNTDLEYLKVNEITRQPDVEGGDTYTVMIPKLATTATIEVKTIHNYATVRIGDNIVVTQKDKGVLDCSDLTQDRIVVPVVVTAADGTTVRTYNVVLLRGSNDTQIELKVNDEIISPDADGNYTTKVLPTIDNINILATALNEGITGIYASIDVNATGVYETPSKQVTIGKEVFEGKDMIKVPIQIIAEDGTKQDRILTIEILGGTYITGKILTENVNGEHISEVIVYKTNDVSDPRTEVVRVQTDTDGTFKALIYIADENNFVDTNGNGIADALEEKYDVVVSKPGYLSYTVTDIEVFEGQSTELEEYKLIAGDTVESGEIQVFDLVALNENFGVVITDENREEKERYDLNGDGIVDSIDRNILKANYTKLAETVQWVNPNTVEMLMNNLEESEEQLSTETEQTVESQVENALESVEDAVQNENLENTETDDGANVSGTNELILPIATPYTITSEYGERINPVTGEESKHTGIDIVGEWHTEILSVASGEVTYVGTNEAFGNCVEIKHIVNGETIYSFYAHLSRIDVEVGEQVAQGQVIGLEGGAESDPNPGYSTGHHLHFEIRKASGYGNDVNPRDYIKF